MTRKEYVVQVTQELIENTKGCLAGHGINGAIMKMISERPDVLGKLATFAFNTANAKRYGKGLKKAGNFKISAYRTFGEFADNAATDVETFMAGLSPDDAASFTNNDNISVIIVQADQATGNVEADIANLKSEIVPFDTYSKKAYKFPGVYITLMYGDSAISMKAGSVAEVKATVNKKIVARKNPAKVKALFAAKTKAKLASLKDVNKKLGFEARKTAAELEEINDIRGTFGVAENARQKTLLGAAAKYTAETKKYLSSLSRKDKKYWKAAYDAKAEGKVKLMIANLAEISPENSERVTAIVRGGNLTTGDAVLAARRKQFQLKIAEITTANEALLTAAENAPNAKTRGNINFKIRANVEKIKLLRAKMDVHKSLVPGVIKSKATLLKETNARIEENRLKGLSLQDSLKSAIAQLPVTAQQKMQIQQEVVSQLAAGTQLGLAVQQSIQNQTIQQLPQVTAEFDELEDDSIIDVFGNMDDETADIASELANSKSIADVLAFL